MKCILFLATIIAMCSCKGDPGDVGPAGAQGQAGATGATGATGAQGPAGSANVIYSNWFSPISWFGTNGGWYFDKITTDLSQNILDKGVILVYTKDPIGGPNTIYPLPYTFFSGVTYSYAVITAGDLRIFTNLYALPPTYLQYRYVVIPGGVLGSGRVKPVDYSNYSEVAKHYNITD